MVALGMLIGFRINDKTDAPLITKVPRDSHVSIGRVEEILRFIEAKYVDTIDSEILVTEAINAMLDRLDPHSIYLPPSALQEENESMGGSFRGIGIESLMINDTLNIMTTVKNGPADKAGLMQFDQIVVIDDTIVAGVKKNFETIRTMLRKDGRNSVKIELKRSGQNLIKIVNISDVALHSADMGRMIMDSVGLIKIENFSANTYKEFMETLEFLVEKKGMRHLVIDLRGNPGGYLPQATKILNQLFKEKDRLLMYTKGRASDVVSEYKSNGKTFFDIKKVFVLVDENSASGSEIIAGVLQDWDRAKIIGRRTYGKGLVQEQFDLSNGGAIRLTTARYYLASGRSIQRPYENHDTYYDEINLRYKNGSLFKQDTAKGVDKKTYKTMVEGRVVYDGHGIDPDVFVPADSSEYAGSYYLLAPKTKEFIYKKLKAGKLIDKDIKSEQSLNSLVDAFVNENKSEFNKYKIRTPKGRDSIQLKKDIQETFLYISSNGDRNSAFPVSDYNDKFIDAVKKQFKK